MWILRFSKTKSAFWIRIFFCALLLLLYVWRILALLLFPFKQKDGCSECSLHILVVPTSTSLLNQKNHPIRVARRITGLCAAYVQKKNMWRKHSPGGFGARTKQGIFDLDEIPNSLKPLKYLKKTIEKYTEVATSKAKVKTGLSRCFRMPWAKQCQATSSYWAFHLHHGQPQRHSGLAVLWSLWNFLIFCFCSFEKLCSLVFCCGRKVSEDLAEVPRPILSAAAEPKKKTTSRKEKSDRQETIRKEVLYD